MAARSTTDQVQYLLERRVAEARSRGALSTETESVAIFESISLNLLLKPRTVLYFAMLAKNGLRKATQDEIASIDAMKSAILDLGNSVLSVRSTAQLETARLSLLQMEQLDRISTSSNQYRKFDSSINEFLTKTIAKSVRRVGATSLTRPGTEAAQDMTSEFTNLKDLHTDLLDRYYALLVGIANFSHSPLSTIIGLTTASRARSDIEDLIDSIDASGSLPASRDMAVRLIANRAAVKSVGNLPSVNDPVISTTQALPTGYVLYGKTDDSAASVTSAEGPFVLPVSAQLLVTVNGSTIGPTFFPQTTTDLHNRAAIVSSAVSYPISIPSNYYLFLLVDGTSYRFGPYAAGSTSLSSFLSQTSAFISASAQAGILHVEEFISSSTSRVIFHHNTASQIRIDTGHIGADTDLIGGVEATTYAVGRYTNSVDSLVGFDGTEIGTAGSTPTQFIVDAITRLFPSLVTVTQNDANKFTLTTVSVAPGTSMTVQAPTVLGISGQVLATSDSMKLYGTVNGVSTNPVSPIDLLDVGDFMTSNAGSGVVSGLTVDRVKFASPTPTFDGPILVTSALTVAYQALITLLNEFYPSWVADSYSKDLSSIELAVSSLGSGSPQAQRNTVLDALDKLRASLVDLKAKLDDPSVALPSTAAQLESTVANGIISTLEERKFDRALELFLKCRIQEALDSTSDTASFGGSLLKAASDFARTDLIVQNRALDEGVETTSKSQDAKGL